MTNAVPEPETESANVPLYLGVKQMIQSRISNGDWAPGTRVRPRMNLSQSFTSPA